MTDPQHCSPENELADRLYNYVKECSGDWASATPSLRWSDMDTIIGALRRPAQCAPPLSEQQRHAVEHARYQVGHSTPENPECCFDYELVGTLVEIIDRAYSVTRPDGGDPA